MSVTQDANGWTVIGASADTLTIYVSSSDGNDANDGLTAATAKKSIAAGAALMRNGAPDHLLLKRGDTFTLSESLNADGRSTSEPALFGSYGTGERPIVDGGDVSIIHLVNPNFVAIVGWHIDSTRTATTSPKGIDIDGWQICNWVLIEDNYIDGEASGITIDGNDTTNISNVTIRRNVIVNSWNLSSAGHAMGVFVDDVNGLLIEDNFLDHNGWNDAISGAEATVFNHNMYLTHQNRNVTIQNNISSRGASMGLKFQPTEGTHHITNNLFVQNGYGIQLGGGQAERQAGKTGPTIYANDNVVVEGTDNPGEGVGVTVSNVKGGTFSNNVIANKTGTTTKPALSFQDGVAGWESVGVGVRDFTVEDNVIYNWRGQVKIVQPTQSYADGPIPVFENIDFINNKFQEPDASYTGNLIKTFSSSNAVNNFTGGEYYSDGATNQPFIVGSTAMNLNSWKSTTGESNATQEELKFYDPTRTSLTYAASLGLTSYEAFVAEASQQSRGNWNTEFTADAINDYIRAGFDLDPVGVTPLPSPTLGAPAGQTIQQQTIQQENQQQRNQSQQEQSQQQKSQPTQSLQPMLQDSSQDVHQELPPAMSAQSDMTVSLPGDADDWAIATDQVFSELDLLVSTGELRAAMLME